MAQGNPLDDAISKIDELLLMLSARPGVDTAGPSSVASTPAQSSSSGLKAEVHAKPAFHEQLPQQGQQQPKKEKKAAKAPAVVSAPATSGDGLFYRAQLQPGPTAEAQADTEAVVRITAVENTESAKLFKTSIDLGNGESRQVVAGLKGHIPAAELQGRLAVAILNLKPAKLAGMASEAMLLAADAPQSDGTEVVRALQPPEGSEVGDKVFLEGGVPPSEYAKTLKSDPWRSIVEALRVQDGRATFEGKALSTSKGAIKLPHEMPDGASIH